MRSVRASISGITLADVPEPEPGPGQVLVAPLACGVCGIDLHVCDELRRSDDHETTYLLGHEFCAEILEYGPDTDRRIPVGSNVISMPLLTVGEKTETIGLSGAIPGGFSDRLLLDEKLMIAVPEHVSPEHAALAEPLAVGRRAVSAGQVGPDDVALVIGCGPVGCAVLAALNTLGVPAVASDPSPSRRALAASLGATAVVDPGEESPFERWRQLGAQDLPYSPALPAGVHRSNAVIFECVGTPGMLQHVIDQAPGHARLVCVGVCLQPDTIRPSVAIGKELNITFAFAYRPEEFADTLAMIANNEFDPEPFITGVVDLADIDEALEDLKQPDKHVKVLVRP